MKSTVVDESLSTIYNQSSVTEKTTYVLQDLGILIVSKINIDKDNNTT